MFLMWFVSVWHQSYSLQCPKMVEICIELSCGLSFIFLQNITHTNTLVSSLLWVICYFPNPTLHDPTKPPPPPPCGVTESIRVMVWWWTWWAHKHLHMKIFRTETNIYYSVSFQWLPCMRNTPDYLYDVSLFEDVSSRALLLLIRSSPLMLPSASFGSATYSGILLLFLRPQENC